ncbi:hypothetical protein LX32DRAFT_165864 [Colletotrichum zoysiae]|uniref:Uncharacterized protein n=1 Tax=Colletotrichum zoysiae TaxID=1216348 RepID=A0AAD9H762_9PEZI|nr:hypothetical protein LX32DRAFT_165864 [Colletotrichum zoysiae]
MRQSRRGRPGWDERTQALATAWTTMLAVTSLPHHAGFHPKVDAGSPLRGILVRTMTPPPGIEDLPISSHDHVYWPAGGERGERAMYPGTGPTEDIVLCKKRRRHHGVSSSQPVSAWPLVTHHPWLALVVLMETTRSTSPSSVYIIALTRAVVTSVSLSLFILQPTSIPLSLSLFNLSVL